MSPVGASFVLITLFIPTVLMKPSFYLKITVNISLTITIGCDDEVTTLKREHRGP